MREIKFRAWDKDNNCWFEPTYDASKLPVIEKGAMKPCMTGDKQ